MRRIRLSRRRSAGGRGGIIRHVDYGYGPAATPGAPSPGRLVRVIPGLPWANRGVRYPVHPLNFVDTSRYFFNSNPGYY
jgi:hypothetical protein